MEEFINNLETFNEIDYFRTLLSFICCIFLGFSLKYIYIEKSISISNKLHIGNMLPLLSLVTFLVILIVKSSLALSLGLVGALSIVRFRTPIKEPEELIYLFLSIAIGLGYGAGQIVPTSITVIIIFMVIWLFVGSKTKKKSSEFNLIIKTNNEMKDGSEVSNGYIFESLSDHFDEFDLVKFETNENKSTFIVKIILKDIVSIDNFRSQVSKQLIDLEINYYYSDPVY